LRFNVSDLAKSLSCGEGYRERLKNKGYKFKNKEHFFKNKGNIFKNKVYILTNA